MGICGDGITNDIMSFTHNICSLDIYWKLQIFYIRSYLIVIISSHFSIIDHYNLTIFFNSRSVKVLNPIGCSSFILFFMDCTLCIIQPSRSVKVLIPIGCSSFILFFMDCNPWIIQPTLKKTFGNPQ